MKQQTAVEWLEEKLNIWQTISDEDTNSTLNTVRKLLEQAKKMEKEQIIDAYDKNKMGRVNYGEQYYNETYENK